MSELEGFHYIYEPSPTDGERTLLLLHGTGGSERDLLHLGRQMDDEAALIGVRGRVLENGLPRFFRRLAEGVFDLDDLARRTVELEGFVHAVCRTHERRPERLIAVGYSNGANIAASLLLRGGSAGGALGGAVLLRAMVPFTPERAADLRGRAVLLLSGRYDPIVPTSQVEQLRTLLAQANAAVTLHWLETGHGLTAEDVAAASAWLREHG